MGIKFSNFFNNIKPSGLRNAQMMFNKRAEKDIDLGKKPIEAINVAIGNVSLKTYPKMLERYMNPTDKNLINGIWRYTETQGTNRAADAFKNIIRSFLPDNIKPGLHCLVDAGGSNVMRSVVLGVCGDAGTNDRPLLVMDPTYTNYKAVTTEYGRGLTAVSRHLNGNGSFSVVSSDDIQNAIDKYHPGGLLIIPYDNPSGQLMRQKTINEYARLCMENSIFLISDEAYRGLYYTKDEISTIWKTTDKDVPGIENSGIRISIETLSKTFNACGLRMGALVTDNKEFYEKSVSANTTYLCPSAIDMHIIEALADETKEDIQNWIKNLREYYNYILHYIYDEFNKELPGIVMSVPESSIYFVVDVRDIAKKDFNAEDFVEFCAKEGEININGRRLTLLVSPMWGFYNISGDSNPGKTQVRIACVEPEDKMKLVPKLFAELFREYESKR